MTKFEAWKEAHARWAKWSPHPVMHYSGFVRVRVKSVAHRYEVGRKCGGTAKVTILGRGDSWEEAFAMAERDAAPASNAPGGMGVGG